MIRNISSLVAGLGVAIITFLFVESINHSIHPLPTNLDFNNQSAVQMFYEKQPVSLWLLLLLGWTFGSLLCGFIVKLISKNNNIKMPIIAGFILTLSAIANFFSLPHPTWVIVVGIIVFIPSVLIGHKIYKVKVNGK